MADEHRSPKPFRQGSRPMTDTPERELIERLRSIMFTASDEAALEDHNTTREASLTIEALLSRVDKLEERVIEQYDTIRLQAQRLMELSSEISALNRSAS